jgi:hypothetical protein
LIISSTAGVTETRGSHWFIIFYFQQLLLLAKIDPTEIEDARKADKQCDQMIGKKSSQLFQKSSQKSSQKLFFSIRVEKSSQKSSQHFIC